MFKDAILFLNLQTSCERDVSKCIPDEEDVEKDGANSYGENIHYRENLKRTGHVIYTVRC